MAYRDPLEDWLFGDEFGLRPQMAAEHLAGIRQALQELEAYLKRPPAKTLRGRSLFNLRLAGLQMRRPLPPAELALAERLYRRLYEVGGTGTTYVQEALLNAIGVSRNPSSISFWLEILGWSRPRDAFARPRRTLALATLATWPSAAQRRLKRPCARPPTTPTQMCAPWPSIIGRASIWKLSDHSQRMC